jgi:geranylgeranyl diphosphate synthase, type I
VTQCINCGTEIVGAERYCSYCGTFLKDALMDVRFLSNSSNEVAKLSPQEPANELMRSSFEFVNYVRPVNTKLLELHKNQPAVLYAINMSDHLMSAVIPQLACEAVGGRSYDALVLSYSYSLGMIAGRIMDDMMDRTVARRGKKTVWKEFGDPVAIPLALWLISEMFDALSAYDSILGRIESDRLIRTFRSAMRESSRAEEEEKLARKSKADLSFKEGVKLAQGKRGILIAAGTAAGGIVGRGSEEEILLLKNYGMYLGTANQLFDDSGDVDYPKAYREKALAESRDLTAEAVKCTDKLNRTEAQGKLRNLSKISEVPLI